MEDPALMPILLVMILRLLLILVLLAMQRAQLLHVQRALVATHTLPGCSHVLLHEQKDIRWVRFQSALQLRPMLQPLLIGTPLVLPPPLLLFLLVTVLLPLILDGLLQSRWMLYVLRVFGVVLRGVPLGLRVQQVVQRQCRACLCTRQRLIRRCRAADGDDGRGEAVLLRHHCGVNQQLIVYVVSRTRSTAATAAALATPGAVGKGRLPWPGVEKVVGATGTTECRLLSAPRVFEAGQEGACSVVGNARAAKGARTICHKACHGVGYGAGGVSSGSAAVSGGRLQERPQRVRVGCWRRKDVHRRRRQQRQLGGRGQGRRNHVHGEGCGREDVGGVG